LRRGVASSFAVGFTFRDDHSRGRDPERDARVFRPCSRGADSSCNMTPRLIADSAVANSLRPSAGGANEETAPRARDCRPAARLDSLLAVEPGSQSPGPASLANGFSAHESSGPHAPSTNSIFGPDHESTCLADPSPRGLRRPFDLCLPGAPFCGGQRPPAPFRATGLLHRSTLRLVRPHGQPSDTAPRCLESVSTTDVSRHEHPCRNITLGDCRRAPWETRRRSTSRSPVGLRTLLALAIPRATPDHLAVIRPPTASRLTARCRLRDDRLPRSCAWREVG